MSFAAETPPVPVVLEGSNVQIVHFIWVGDLNGAFKKLSCRLGVSSLCSWSPEATIWFWVPDHLLMEAHSLFSMYLNVQVKSIDQFLAGEFQYVDKASVLRRLDELKTKPLAFAKDLLSFVIVIEHGGFFFDATMVFVGKPNLTLRSDLKIAAISRDLDIFAFAAAKPNNTVFVNTLNLYLIPEFLTRSEPTSIVFLLRNALEKAYPHIGFDLSVKEKLLWHFFLMSSTDLIGFKTGDHLELRVNKISTASWREGNYLDIPQSSLIMIVKESIKDPYSLQYIQELLVELELPEKLQLWSKLELSERQKLNVDALVSNTLLQPQKELSFRTWESSDYHPRTFSDVELFGKDLSRPLFDGW